MELIESKLKEGISKYKSQSACIFTKGSEEAVIFKSIWLVCVEVAKFVVRLLGVR